MNRKKEIRNFLILFSRNRINKIISLQSKHFFPMRMTDYIYKTNNHTRKVELKIKTVFHSKVSEEIQNDVYSEFLYGKQNDYNTLAEKFNLSPRRVSQIITSKFAEKKY